MTSSPQTGDPRHFSASSQTNDECRDPAWTRQMRVVALELDRSAPAGSGDIPRHDQSDRGMSFDSSSGHAADRADHAEVLNDHSGWGGRGSDAVALARWALAAPVLMPIVAAACYPDSPMYVYSTTASSCRSGRARSAQTRVSWSRSPVAACPAPGASGACGHRHAGSGVPAATSRPPSLRPPITVRTPLSSRSARQQPGSPDSPGRFISRRGHDGDRSF